jgi:hypothetical protein
VGDGGANFYLCCLLLLADFDKQWLKIWIRMMN